MTSTTTPAFIVPTTDVMPAVGKGLCPISDRTALRCAKMLELATAGTTADYLLMGSKGMFAIQLDPNTAQSVAFKEWRTLAEGKRTPRAIIMLFALMLNQCGPTTVSKDELNVQLREEYGVDVEKAFALGAAPPVDADYEAAEARIAEALKHETSTLVEVGKMA